MSALHKLLSLLCFFLFLGCEPATVSEPGTKVAAAPAVVSGQPVAPVPAPAANTPVENPKSLKDVLKTPEHAKALRSTLNQAGAALAAGDKEKALDLLDDALALDQMHLQATKLKAGILRSMGQYDKALEALAGPIKNYPMEFFLIEEKARVLIDKGDAKEAIATLEPMLVQDLPLLGARYLRAVAAALAGDREGALLSLEDAVARGFLSRAMIEQEKRFAFLQGEARFAAILNKLKGVEDASQRGVETLTALEVPNRMPDAGPADFTTQINSLLRSAKLARAEVAPIDLLDLDGKPLRLEDFKGKVLLVQCWGMWSEDSRKMIPDLIRVRDEYKSKGVEVIALCYEPAVTLGDEQETAHDIKAYQRDFKFDVVGGIMTKKNAVDLFVNAFPTLLIYGIDGKLYSRAPGFKPYHVLKGMVDIMLQEKPGSGVAQPDAEKKY